MEEYFRKLYSQLFPKVENGKRMIAKFWYKVKQIKI